MLQKRIKYGSFPFLSIPYGTYDVLIPCLETHVNISLTKNKLAVRGNVSCKHEGFYKTDFLYKEDSRCIRILEAKHPPSFKK